MDRLDEDDRRGLLLAALGVAAGAALAVTALRRVRESRYDFRGRVVLITGGSRGLGLVLARELAAEGARLALCARDPQELERARQELSRRAEVLAVPCDVSDQEQVEAFVAAARERYGRVDVLINNAGIIQVGPMESMRLEDYREAMGVHFWGPLYGALAVLPEMRERGEGRIVNIASIGGKVAFPHLLPYNASKFALVGLSEGLHAELAKAGIRVTTVCPGLMRTGSHRNAWFKGRHRDEYTWFTLGDSLPGSSVSAETAARQILAACRRGDAELTISLPAQAAAAVHGVFPGITAEVLGLVNGCLPQPGGIGAERVRGRDSETPLTRSPLTGLARSAAVQNNEEAPGTAQPG